MLHSRLTQAKIQERRMIACGLLVFAGLASLIWDYFAWGQPVKADSGLASALLEVAILVADLVFAWRYSSFVYKSWLLALMLVSTAYDAGRVAIGNPIPHGTLSVAIGGLWIITGVLFYIHPAQTASSQPPTSN